MQAFSACVAFLLVSAVVCSPLATREKRASEGPVHFCLIACGVCFDDSDDAMMECANEVCLARLSNGKSLPRIWQKTCPMLHKVWIKSEGPKGF